MKLGPIREGGGGVAAAADEGKVSFARVGLGVRQTPSQGPQGSGDSLRSLEPRGGFIIYLDVDNLENTAVQREAGKGKHLYVGLQ